MYSRFAAQLRATDDLTDTLGGDGLAVFDGVLGAETCAALREEIDMLHATGKLLDSPNKLLAVGRDDPSGEEVVIINKPGVLELTVVTTSDQEGEPPQIDPALESTPVLRELYTQVGDLMQGFNAAAPFLELTSLYHLKVARLSLAEEDQEREQNENEPRRRKRKPPAFAAHFDTQPGTGRTLSLCLWINAGWTPSDGGELRVFPAPLAHRDVSPLCDRVAIFCSHHMLHRVRPLQAGARPRYCVSMMFRGSPAPFPSRLPRALANALAGIDADVLAMLELARKQQRDLVMLIFEAESIASTREAFGEHADTDPHDAATVERVVRHFEQRLSAARTKVAPAILQLIDDFLPLDPASFLGIEG